LIHDAVEFREFPNLLNEHGQVRNLETSLEGVKKARMILTEQNYAITGVVEDGEKLAVEKIWTGRVSMDIGGLKKGQELKAYIFAVVEFKDGKIYRHRTYDCYEPFE
jgi:predicted ester cyclase